MKQPIIGTIYRHYKGKEYKVVGIGHHTETLERLVLYQALYNDPKFGTNAFWVRPLEMFMEEITFDEKIQPRFALVKSSLSNECVV